MGDTGEHAQAAQVVTFMQIGGVKKYTRVTDLTGAWVSTAVGLDTTNGIHRAAQ